MPRILVADDNSNIQKMVALAFEEQGIDVIAVGNGEAAVRRLPDVLPDVVLADVFMPVRNGYEVCEYVKKDKRFAHMPVILLVGAFDPLDEVEARRVGADGVLKKPFVPPDPLISMVMGIIAKLPKPEPKVEPAPAVVAPPRVVPAPPPFSASPEPSPDEEVYAFGTGRRSLDDDSPAELSTVTQKVAAQPAAQAKVVTAIEAPAGAAEEEENSFNETNADWRRRDEVDSASVPDFSAELCPEPAPPAVEEPPAPPPVPEREVGPIEFLDATETGQTVAELEAPPEPERSTVAVEYFEPPAESPAWPPKSIHERAISAPDTDVLVVEHETVEHQTVEREPMVEAEAVIAAPAASSSTTVEAAPEPRVETPFERNDTPAMEHRSDETRAHLYESDAQRYNEAASDHGAAPLIDLVAPALAQPTEWSVPREVASATAAPAETISEVRSEVHEESHSEAPAPVEAGFADVSSSSLNSSAVSDVVESALHDSSFAHTEVARVSGRDQTETHESVETQAPATEQFTHESFASTETPAAIGDVPSVGSEAASTRFPEETRAAAEEESAIRAEAEAVARWEASRETRLEPESAPASMVADTISAAVEEIAAPAHSADFAETVRAAQAEAEAPPSHATETDAATIAANAVLASLAGGEALLPNRAAAPETSASQTLAATSPAAAQTPQPSVDEVVAKVLERLGPQLQEILANGLVRPLVEGLLNNQKSPNKKE